MYPVQIYNLGTGRGYSVLEMVKAVEKASGRPVSVSTVFVFKTEGIFRARNCDQYSRICDLTLLICD